MNRVKYVYIGWCLFFLGISGCVSKTVAPKVNQTIAVWDLSDYSASQDSRTHMEEVLTAKFIQALQTIPDITVVERQKLALALDELNIGTTAVTDESTRLKIGKILGATQMVFGGYQVFGDMMRLDIRLVDVETGKIIKAIEKTVPGTGMTEWLAAAEAAARELVE
ncbi:MAG: CsgG/HfaB family protein [Proteobacteria bacterium]|nr:CsgG/HfaB family protein [Pseudomonadota bacterium]